MPIQFRSEPEDDEYTETPHRVRAVVMALLFFNATDHQHVHYSHYSDEEGEIRTVLTKIHDVEYLHWLQNVYKEWEVSGEDPLFGNAEEGIVADTFAPRHVRTRPSNPLWQMGWWAFDRNAPIVKNTYEAAIGSVNCAIDAAKCILHKKSQTSLALCRPPGHHAGYDSYGGFSYLNNAAAAAQYLIDKSEGNATVAILDIDYHHGNGTQDIFYRRKDVLYVSIHADPNKEFPYFSGYTHEVGDGEGKGYNLNIPLDIVLPHEREDDPDDGQTLPLHFSHGVTFEDYCNALHKALRKVRRFNPSYLIVSLGVDTFEEDPVGGFGLSDQSYGAIGDAISSLKLPSVVVFEGGYNLEGMGRCVANFLKGLDGSDEEETSSVSNCENGKKQNRKKMSLEVPRSSLDDESSRPAKRSKVSKTVWKMEKSAHQKRKSKKNSKKKKRTVGE